MHLFIWLLGHVSAFRNKNTQGPTVQNRTAKWQSPHDEFVWEPVPQPASSLPHLWECKRPWLLGDHCEAMIFIQKNRSKYVFYVFLYMFEQLPNSQSLEVKGPCFLFRAWKPQNGRSTRWSQPERTEDCLLKLMGCQVAPKGKSFTRILDTKDTLSQKCFPQWPPSLSQCEGFHQTSLRATWNDSATHKRIYFAQLVGPTLRRATWNRTPPFLKLLGTRKALDAWPSTKIPPEQPTDSPESDRGLLVIRFAWMFARRCCSVFPRNPPTPLWRWRRAYWGAIRLH